MGAHVEKLFEDGLTALRKERYNLAYDLFSEAMEMEPEISQIHYNRGLAAGGLYRWEEAATCFRLAARIQQHPDYWTHLGLANLHLRRWKEALQDFGSALDLDPSGELPRAHRDDLVEFLKAEPVSRLGHPLLCADWFDPRLEDYVGVDPEIVPKGERMELREYLKEALAASDGSIACDHTHRSTEEWAFRTGKDPMGVSRFLYQRGMRCDCEVLQEPERAKRNR